MSRLNLTRGISLSHIQDASANPSITNSITIVPPASVQPDTIGSRTASVSYPEVQPHSATSTPEFEPPPDNSEGVQEVKYRSIDNEEAVDEIEYLKSIIRIYMAQKFTFEGKQIVCTVEELKSLIRALTGGEVSIETQDVDIECGCCTSNDIPLKSITKI